MKLIERSITDSSTAIRIVEGASTATLELHNEFFTYYWRCRFGPSTFVNRLDYLYTNDMSVTLMDRSGQVQQLSSPEAGNKFVSSLEQNDADDQWWLVRFDGPTLSWVWQYAPDDRSIPKSSDTFERNGLIAYVGCASMMNHMGHFYEASKFLESSAVESDKLYPHLRRFEGYLSEWEEHQ